MYRDRTLPRLRNVQGWKITKVYCTLTVHLPYTYCTLTVHLLCTTGFEYTCTVNWSCVRLYSKLVLCKLHWQLKDERWNSVLGTDNQNSTLEWTRTEQNCFDKLTEVRNFTSGLTECTGDGAYICITSGENGFEGLTSGRTSRAAPSQLKMTWTWTT